MTNNVWIDKAKDRSKGKSDPRSAAIPVKTGQMTSPPLMTKTHYSFEEAFRFIKSRFANFTHENFLNHGFQRDISFFVKVPPGIKVRSSAVANGSIAAIPPLYLILDPLDCEEIEGNGVAHIYHFPTGYRHDGTNYFQKALPNYSSIFFVNPLWLIYKNNQLVSLPVASKNLFVVHSDIIRLLQLIECVLEDGIHEQNKTVILKKIHAELLSKSILSLKDAANQNSGCKPMDLLRRAIQRNLVLLAVVPDGITVRSSNVEDYASGVEYFLPPKLLALSPSDCTGIYIEGNISMVKFSAGYIFHNSDQLKRVTPTDERPWLASGKISWMTYRDNSLFALQLNCESLHVMQSDMTELLNQGESQKFTISRELITSLSLHGFVSFDRAVEITKLHYPECTLNHLLHLKCERQFEIVTPVPIGIVVRKTKTNEKGATSFYDVKGSPIYLVLSTATFRNIKQGQNKEDSFQTYYSASSFQSEKCEPADLSDYAVSTCYENNLHKIELNLDLLYINKYDLLQMIKHESTLWIAINKSLRDQTEDKKNEAEELNLSFDASQENVQTKPLSLDAIEISSNRTPDNIENNLENTVEMDQVTDQDHGRDEIKSTPISSTVNNNLLCRSDLMKILNISKSGMYERMKPTSNYYDSTFPRPLKEGSGKKYWLEADVKAYMQMLISRRPGTGAALAKPVSGSS